MQIPAGATSQSVLIYRSNLAINPMIVKWMRNRSEGSQDLTTVLNDISSGWSSGAYRIGVENPKYMRFDLPNAWLVAGSRSLCIQVQDDSGYVAGAIEIEITGTDNANGEVFVKSVAITNAGGENVYVDVTVVDSAGTAVTGASPLVAGNADGVATSATHQGSGKYRATKTRTSLGMGPSGTSSPSQGGAVVLIPTGGSTAPHSAALAVPHVP